MEFHRFPLKWKSVFWTKKKEAIEPLAFHRVIALLRTDRNHEQKLVLTRLLALSPSRSVPTWGLWTFSAKYPFYLNIKLSCSAVFICSEQIPRYFAVTICLSRGFLKCSFLKTGREGFRSWGSPLWIMPPNCPFLSPILVSYQMHPENFWCVPPKRSIPILQLSVEKNSLDLSLEKHNLGRLFFLSQQQLCLEYLLFSTPRWGYFSSSMPKKGNECHKCTSFPDL